MGVLKLMLCFFALKHYDVKRNKNDKKKSVLFNNINVYIDLDKLQTGKPEGIIGLTG